jgi:hypothetical protein
MFDLPNSAPDPDGSIFPRNIFDIIFVGNIMQVLALTLEVFVPWLFFFGQIVPQDLR